MMQTNNRPAQSGRERKIKMFYHEPPYPPYRVQFPPAGPIETTNQRIHSSQQRVAPSFWTGRTRPTTTSLVGHQRRQTDSRLLSSTARVRKYGRPAHTQPTAHKTLLAALDRPNSREECGQPNLPPLAGQPIRAAGCPLVGGTVACA